MTKENRQNLEIVNTLMIEVLKLRQVLQDDDALLSGVLDAYYMAAVVFCMLDGQADLLRAAANDLENCRADLTLLAQVL